MPEPLPAIYVDGQSGTTGLRIHELLKARTDLRTLHIDPARRRELEARRALFAEADVVVLCLPDDAARQAVTELAASLGEAQPRIIDASTAHRVAEGWVYGLPELAPGQRDAIRAAQRVANPGCWPTGFNLLLRPLVDAGLLAPELPLVVHGLSGYTGGGKELISRWEDPQTQLRTLPFEAPYALDRRHKHVPEMVRYAGLQHAPVFVPAVGPFPCGMRLEIPLHAAWLEAGVDAAKLQVAYEARYAEEPAVGVLRPADILAARERGLDPLRCNGLNRVEVVAMGHPDGHVVLCALLDNLAKGASGAAVQNLNLMLGLPEFAGLATSHAKPE